MIAVVLTILKFIGIFLLWALALFLVLILSLLFLPFGYRMKALAKGQLEEGTVMKGEFLLTFLFVFLRLKIKYEKDVFVLCRVLGIPVFKTTIEVTNKSGAWDENPEEKSKHTEQNKPKSTKANSNAPKGIANKLAYTWEKLCATLKKLKEKIDFLKKLWNHPRSKAARALLITKGKALLRHICPRKMNGYAAFGFEDPAYTGYVLGLYGVMYPLTKGRLDVDPDFEHPKLDLNLNCKGRFLLFYIISCLIQVYFSKDVRFLKTGINRILGKDTKHDEGK